MTPGPENERGGEGGRSSRRSPRRRTASKESGAAPPTASSTEDPTPPDQPAGRSGTRGRRVRGTEPAAAPSPGATRRGRHGRQPAAPVAFAPEEVIDEAAPLTPRVPDSPASQMAGAEPEEAASAGLAGRRGREARRAAHSNALGVLIEASFADPNTPVHSYSELERRSRISREALSRYVTPRADRRRSPTIETLATIAEAMHLSLEQVCRAAAASSRGVALPSSAEQRMRDEVAAPLLATLSDQQFAAIIELLRQMQLRSQPEA